MLVLGRGGKQTAPELQTDLAFRQSHIRYVHPAVPADLLPWVYIMRLAGLLCGVGTIVLTFFTVREVLASEEHAPLAVAEAGMGLLPEFIFISSVVNNDLLATVVGAAVTYLLARALMRGVHWHRAILLGVVLGTGLLSKANLLVYLPIALLALALPGLPAFTSGQHWTRQRGQVSSSRPSPPAAY